MSNFYSILVSYKLNAVEVISLMKCFAYMPLNYNLDCISIRQHKCKFENRKNVEIKWSIDT